MISNIEFLRAIFGESYIYAHVTSFNQDPADIPNDQRAICWAGGYYKDVPLTPNSNQFYTVSLFSPDDSQKSRRRKAHFAGTYVVGLDDVKEKLPVDQVMRLPAPSIVLKSSLHSEQWLYILNTPEQNQNRVDNLHDGLIKNGLAPNSKDPGQKGVTRYLRLPEGVNTKAKRIAENEGVAPRCEVTLFCPERRYTLEQLAEPFDVDLNATRADKRIDGASDVSDHPILHTGLVNIKSVISPGRWDVTCPWVDEHTDADDSGTAIFTNSDGTLGFKCHHGNCENKTGADLLRYIESHSPGFSSKLKNWQVMRDLTSVSSVSFMQPSTPVQPATPTPAVSFLSDPQPAAPVPTAESVTPDAIQLLCDSLRRERPSSPEARELAQKILKYVDDLPKIDQKHWHDITCDLMSWSKSDFKEIITDLRKQWYGERVSKAEFYDTVVFVKELNQFYDWESRIFFSTEAFQNSFAHEDAEARKIALQDGRVQKVDKLDYAPKQPRIFVENGCRYGNLWSDKSQSTGTPGDITPWLRHFELLGWEEHRDHIAKWMAFTLRHPERKINHMLLLGSGEGCGKDWLLYPLTRAMGENYDVISGEELLSDYHDYVLSTKYLHINEAELGDRREALAVSNKLKPLAAAPPEQLSVNQKGIKRIKVRNILNATMTTNSVMPLRLNGASRRFYGVWSDFNPRDAQDNMKPEWLKYWEDHWAWMKQGGWQYVVNYLMTQVDLSEFSPGAPPPMTEFLRDIKEQSKSPMQQTVELFIQKEHGAFRCDLLTTSDMSEVLRAGALVPADMLCDPKYFTPKRLGSLLREMGSYRQIRSGSARLWVLRNDEKYAEMTSTQAYHEYERQVREARGEASLVVVK